MDDHHSMIMAVYRGGREIRAEEALPPHTYSLLGVETVADGATG